jgi:preprotein translocase subunit YajC
MPRFLWVARAVGRASSCNIRGLMMSGLISNAYAQTGTAAPSIGGLGTLIWMAAFVAIFYFMLLRPQQKRAKDQQNMMGKLASGDEVATSGGLVGRIVEVGESLITLELAEGVRVKLQKNAVTQVLPKGSMKGG